jgi:hypothetical protein
MSIGCSPTRVILTCFGDVRISLFISPSYMPLKLSTIFYISRATSSMTSARVGHPALLHDDLALIYTSTQKKISTNFDKIFDRGQSWIISLEASGGFQHGKQICRVDIRGPSSGMLPEAHARRRSLVRGTSTFTGERRFRSIFTLF